MKTVGIHQPNYLPWLGFFDKLAKSDVFVIFDNVQFPRGKQHFGHRNMIKSPNGEGKWLTVPLVGKSEMKNFNEIPINYNGWNLDHLNLIKSYYGKSRKFDNLFYSELESVLKVEYKSLSQLNTSIIRLIMKWLDIRTELVFCSELCGDNVTGGERIMHLLKTLGATHYISGTGPGSMRYINEVEFLENNIQLVWQNYVHPKYPQQYGEFKENMSVIDLILNCGVESKSILLN